MPRTVPIVLAVVAGAAFLVLLKKWRNFASDGEGTSIIGVTIAGGLCIVFVILAVLVGQDKKESAATVKQAAQPTATASASPRPKKSAVKPGSQQSPANTAANNQAANARRKLKAKQQRIVRIQKRKHAMERKLRKQLSRASSRLERAGSMKEFWKRLAKDRKARLIVRHLWSPPAPSVSSSPGSAAVVTPRSSPAPQPATPAYVPPASTPRPYVQPPAPTTKPASKPHRKPGGFGYGGLGGASAPDSSGGGTGYDDSA
jgi:hypothetical protein